MKGQTVVRTPVLAGSNEPDEVDAFGAIDEQIVNLRPKTLTEYGRAGQRTVVENLGIAIEAARKREEPLDHVLLHGPPGLGKTTLAHVIANEMEAPLIGSSGPALESQDALMSILTNLDRGSILFVDEIHRLPREIGRAHV